MVMWANSCIGPLGSLGSQIVRAAIREARFLSAVSHCNLVALKEAYRSGSGRVYLVMEFCDHTLSQQIRVRFGR